MSGYCRKIEVEYNSIADFPGYRIGDDGSVWSCLSRGPSFPKVTNSWRLLKGTSRKTDRRVQVSLCKNNVPIKFYVHRLVLEAFVGPCPPGMECCHKNDDCTDNRLENLRWDTPQKNLEDAWKNGKVMVGEQRWNSKLTVDKVVELRTKRKNGKSIKDLSVEFGVSKAIVSEVANGKRWSHVP